MSKRPLNHYVICCMLGLSFSVGLASTGCSNTTEKKQKQPTQNLQANPHLAELNTAARWMPNDTVMLLSFDVQPVLALLFKSYLGGHTDKKAAQAYADGARKELSALSISRFGQDLTTIQHVMVAVSNRSMSVVIKGVKGDITSAGATDVGKYKVFSVRSKSPADAALINRANVKGFKPSDDTLVLAFPKGTVEKLITDESNALSANTTALEAFKKTLPTYRSHASASVLIQHPGFRKSLARDIQPLTVVPQFVTLSLNQNALEFSVFDSPENLETLKAEVLKAYDKGVDGLGADVLNEANTIKDAEKLETALMFNVSHHAAELHRSMFSPTVGKRSMTYKLPIKSLPIVVGAGMNLMGMVSTAEIIQQKRWQMSYAAQSNMRKMYRTVRIAHAAAMTNGSSTTCDHSIFKEIAPTPLITSRTATAHVFGKAWAQYNFEGKRDVLFSYSVKKDGPTLKLIAQRDYKPGGKKHTVEININFKQKNNACIVTYQGNVLHNFE